MSECQTWSPPSGDTQNVGEDFGSKGAATWTPPKKAFFVGNTDDANEQNTCTEELTTTFLMDNNTTTINIVTPERSTAAPSSSNVKANESNDDDSAASLDQTREEKHGSKATIPKMTKQQTETVEGIDRSNRSSDCTQPLDDNVFQRHVNDNEASQVSNESKSAVIDREGDESEELQTQNEQQRQIQITRSSVGLFDPKIGEIAREAVTSDMPPEKTKELAADSDDDYNPRITISRTQSFDEDEDDDYDVVWSPPQTMCKTTVWIPPELSYFGDE